MAKPAAEHKKLKQTQKVLLERVPAKVENGQSKFARALGSVDYATREKGLQALSRWLIYKKELQQQDVLKIWKGLFYCFWHSDKTPVQTELAERLAGILPQMSEGPGFLYFATFMTTVRREWLGIDKLRLDKFLMLVRKFMVQMFATLRQHKWQPALVDRYMKFLEQHVLLPTDHYNALGIAHHVADVYLPSLQDAVADTPPPAAAAMALLQPFCAALASVGEDSTLKRYRESVFDEVLDALHSPAPIGPLSKLEAASLAERLFELGAEPGRRTRNRDVLYGMHAAVKRVLAKRQRVEAVTAPAPAAVAATENGATEAADVGAAAAAAAVVGKKRKKKAADAGTAGVADAEADAAATANGHLDSAEPVGVASETRRKKKKKHAGDGDEETTSVSDRAAAAATAAVEPAPMPVALGSEPLKSTKKKRKKHLAAAAADTPEAAVAAKPAGSTPGADDSAAAGTTISKRKRAAEDASPASTPAAAMPATNGKAPSSTPNTAGSKKGKHAATAVAAAAAAPEATVSPATTPKRPLSNGKHRGQAANVDSRAATAAAPQLPPATVQPKRTASRVEVAEGAQTAVKKKRVRINEENNLFFAFGGPIPPSDVRTPTSAKPKGAALKAHVRQPLPQTQPPPEQPQQQQQPAPKRRSPAAPASAPGKLWVSAAGTPKQQQNKRGQQRGGRVSPKSLPRPKAANFFNL